MKKNNLFIVMALVIFCVIVCGGFFIKNLQNNNDANKKFIYENTKTNEGIKNILIDSIKLDKWNDFESIQCKQGDALENSQVLKEVKEKIQEVNKSEILIQLNEDIILLKKLQSLNNQSEDVLKFNVLNKFDDTKCIQIIS